MFCSLSWTQNHWTEFGRQNFSFGNFHTDDTIYSCVSDLVFVCLVWFCCKNSSIIPLVSVRVAETPCAGWDGSCADETISSFWIQSCFTVSLNLVDPSVWEEMMQHY